MFTKLCSAGLTAFIGFQALVNIGGTTRALPMTGITLPFVSHGGFSLITSFAMLGMLLAFSHRNASDAESPVGRPRRRRGAPTRGGRLQSPGGGSMTDEPAGVRDRGGGRHRPRPEREAPARTKTRC